MERAEIISALKADDDRELFRCADAVRKKYCGDEVHIRGIIEFSNYCKRDCTYCGIRSSNQNLTRYRMPINEIFEAAKVAVKLQYQTLVLQSGEDPAYSIPEICALVRRIKSELGCSLTLCIGEKAYDEYKQLRDAGTDRYLLKFETSNRELFKRLKPDSSYDARLQCLDWLRKLGYQVGSGFMVGLPGQTPEILADDILMARNMDLDMIGIGPFIPHQDTPLRESTGGDLKTTLKVVALTRIVTKNAHMPATTAIGSIDLEGRQKALKCGANVIMPNVTPQAYRKLYQIYPNKICINDQPGDCRLCIEGMVHDLGRTPAKGHGHSLKRPNAAA